MSPVKITMNDESSAKLSDAIHENNLELAKTLFDGGKVDVNIKNDCGDTPFIATCRQATLKLLFVSLPPQYIQLSVYI
jgi:ankyrin repeat protein